LLDSRQRWRELALLAADFAFETDAAGRFTFIAPDPVLGYSALALLGVPLRALLLEPKEDPLAAERLSPAEPLRGRRLWLCRADGGTACLEFALVPLSAEGGGFRGIARDVTREEMQAASTAATLRRSASLELLMRTAQQQGRAEDALRMALARLLPALGCQGAALLDAERPGLSVRHYAGADPAPLLPQVADCLAQSSPWRGMLEERHPGAMLLHRPAGAAPAVALLAWREAGGRPFEEDDLSLLGALTGILGLLDAQDRLQRELSVLAATDPLTGLPNRRAFLASLTERLLAGEGGALIFGDLDCLKPMNDQFGHEAGDVALRTLGRLMAEAAEPEGIAARLGGDEFALWLRGAGAEAAGSVASWLCRMLPDQLPALTQGRPASVSLGLALVAPGAGASVEALLVRADAAMYAAKRNGGGSWSIVPGE
jgi:diguanylate cyclase (GGDEF)-like protein/PAS domain S-box-containing protein